MNQQVKYLALILLVTFAVPKMYKDYHVLIHQAQLKCSKIEHRNAKGINRPGPEKCVICNFEFAVSDFQSFTTSRTFLCFRHYFVAEIVLPKIQNFAGYQFLLRAPPAAIS